MVSFINSFCCISAYGYCFHNFLERKQRASSQLSPLVSPHTWDSYIGARHGSEVAVLLLELMISSAIKSYDVKSGHNPRRKLSRESIMNHNSQSL